MSKKVTLGLLLIGTLYIAGVIFLEFGNYCYTGIQCETIFVVVNFIGLGLFIFPAAFLFSIITYKMSHGVFNSWLKFAIWYIPAYIVFSTILTNLAREDGGWGIPDLTGLFFAIILFLFLIFFIITSLVIVIKKYRELKNKST